MATAKLQQLIRQQRTLGSVALLSCAVWMSPAAAGEWGGWHDYLAREITPEYARDQLPDRSATASHWTVQAGEALLPDFANDLLAEPSKLATRLTLSHEHHASSLTQDGNISRQSPPALLRERSLQREFVSPGVIQQLDDNTFLNMSLVLASQQYGAANLGYVTTNTLAGASNQAFYTPYQETVHGTGLRLGVETALLPWLSLHANYQSRIDMEDFSSLQGVYADPADLDVPARISAGLNFKLFDGFQLITETEQVMYHSINAFPSSLLPQRFLSLLGDSTSPEFEWSNLTVFRFGWDWRVHENLNLKFAYATRSQPLPTANVLAEALQDDLARNSFTFGLNSHLGDYGDLSLNAAYAPAEYAFGGNVLGVVTSDLDKSVEVEMRWSLRY